MGGPKNGKPDILHTFGHRPIYICGEAAATTLKFESRVE